MYIITGFVLFKKKNLFSCWSKVSILSFGRNYRPICSSVSQNSPGWKGWLFPWCWSFKGTSDNWFQKCKVMFVEVFPKFFNRLGVEKELKIQVMTSTNDNAHVDDNDYINYPTSTAKMWTTWMLLGATGWEKCSLVLLPNQPWIHSGIGRTAKSLW